MLRLRSVALTAALVLAATLLTGCIAIKSYDTTQRLQGYLTLRVEVCVSDRDRDTYQTCDPDASGGNTAERDNGFDGDEELNGTHSTEIKRGQLLAGFRVPNGATAPNTFQSTDLSVSMTKSASYTTRLNEQFPPPTGFHWEGYLSADLPFDPTNPNDRQTVLAPEFSLPPGPSGAPFVGPFRWRAVVGLRKTGVGGVSPAASVACNDIDTYVCFDSPQSVSTAHFSTAVSDIGVRAGDAATVGQGETATVTFPIQNLAPVGTLGNRTVALSAGTTVPGATAQTAAPSLNVVASASPTPSQTTAVTVAVPPNTPVGSYTVTLAAQANTNANLPPLIRSNTGTIHVVDKLAPAVRVSTPSDGATFTVGDRVTADYGCTDETGGSGISSCGGPVPSGSAIDTSSPGAKTFTVDGVDAAGNRTSIARTYSVVSPPPVIIPTTPPARISVTVAFDFVAGAKSTKFSLLQVKGVASGATVEATCKGTGCPTQKVKGKRRNVVFTKKNASGTVSLKAFLKKSLRAGTVLTVTVTKPGSFGMVKKLTVKANKRPTVTTTCLQPNAKTRAACS